MKFLFLLIIPTFFLMACSPSSKTPVSGIINNNDTGLLFKTFDDKEFPNENDTIYGVWLKDEFVQEKEKIEVSIVLYINKKEIAKEVTCRWQEDGLVLKAISRVATEFKDNQLTTLESDYKKVVKSTDDNRFCQTGMDKGEVAVFKIEFPTTATLSYPADNETFAMKRIIR